MCFFPNDTVFRNCNFRYFMYNIEVVHSKREDDTMKLKRSERLIDMTQRLLDNPHTLISLTTFTTLYQLLLRRLLKSKVLGLFVQSLVLLAE